MHVRRRSSAALSKNETKAFGANFNGMNGAT